MRTAFIVISLVLAVKAGDGAHAAEFHIGSGQTYATLGAFKGWLALQPGDTVFIHPGTYHEKIGIRARGSAKAPVRIIGIADRNGNRPLISGIDATTDSQFKNYFSATYTEDLGEVYIGKSEGSDRFGYRPSHILLSGLAVAGANRHNSFTSIGGKRKQWHKGAAGIRVQVGVNITIDNCEVTGNGNGIFVLSKNNNEGTTSRNIVVQRCFVHDNGNSGSYGEHNIYTQAAGITFQNNRIGRLVAGSTGSALKDRSSNTVIRYNFIEAGARNLDLVEPDNDFEILTAEPGFHDTWVYGNVITNIAEPGRASCTNMIHYGGDSGVTGHYRKGVLHFYHNTVYIEKPLEYWYVRLFDLSTNEESVEMHNNIVHTRNHSSSSNLYVGNKYGTVNLTGANWFTTGWTPFYAGASGSMKMAVKPLSGAEPGFVDAAASDFRLSALSPALGAASRLPVSITHLHNMTRQYLPGAPEQELSSVTDLGAISHIPRR